MFLKTLLGNSKGFKKSKAVAGVLKTPDSSCGFENPK